MTTVADILDVLEALAPTGMKMDWDNVGLLCGSRKKEVEQVLVALDPFEDVCDEAVIWGADVIVTHHPLIFRPVANITDETSVGRIIERLCSAGICAVNAHTNLDCAPGGVNDELAAVLGKETIDTYNTGESRGRETSHSLNYQKLGKELMSQDELAVMDGGKCILQLRGVRPFLSDKYDITQHPNYKYTADADKKYLFDMERYMKRKPAIVKPDEPFEMYELTATDLQ